jgi:hypothetical protein
MGDNIKMGINKWDVLGFSWFRFGLVHGTDTLSSIKVRNFLTSRAITTQVSERGLCCKDWVVKFKKTYIK